MSVSLTYPGVYIEEVPSGVRTITGVATSVTAFVGSALRGEENEPTLVQSFAEYTRVFGSLSRNHPMGFAVSQYFRNGGRDALIVRVTNGGVPATGAADSLDLVAASAGDWGENLSVSTTHPDPAMNPDAATNELFNLIVTDTGTGVTETFNNISVLADNARVATTVLEQQSKLVRVSGTLPGSRPGEVADVAFNADGDDGSAISDPQVSNPGLEASRQGIWALEKAGLFNLLCIPWPAGRCSSPTRCTNGTRPATSHTRPTGSTGRPGDWPATRTPRCISRACCNRIPCRKAGWATSRPAGSLPAFLPEPMRTAASGRHRRAWTPA
jgi:hypothetical protein